MCMKKFGAFLLAGCLLCVGAQVLLEQNAVSITAKAGDLKQSEEGLWFYVYDNGDVSCGGTVNEVTEVMIPDTFIVDGEELKVNKVGNVDWVGFQSAKTISSVHIGANVKSIENQAFNGYALLTEIEIPEGVENIGICAFNECSFKTVTLPKSLTTICAGAFGDNENLKSVTFLGGNNLVICPKGSSSSPFKGCTNLETVILGEGVTELGNSAFAGLPALKSINIPATVTTIGNYAFNECAALEEIEVPASVETIGDYAFFKNSNLKTVKLNEGLKTIGASSFRLIGAEELVIPATVEKIGSQAFESSGFKKITFLGKDTQIAENANLPSNCVICGYEGSTAQTYAEQHSMWSHYTFEALDAQPTEEPAPEILLGDADQNGEVDILDVISINKAILGKENLSENGLKAIDFNGNEKPDSDEAMQVLKFIVGMIENFNA